MELGMNIRKAAISDMPSVANVQIESNRTTYKEIMPAEYLMGLSAVNIAESWNERLFSKNSKEFMYIAESSQEIVGLIAGKMEDNHNPAAGEITSLYIIKEFQKKGIGRHLLKTAALEMQEKNILAVTLWTLEQNPSRFFYEHLGAELTSSRVIDRGGKKLTQVSYLWKDISSLL